jgi:hypothetical protein
MPRGRIRKSEEGRVDRLSAYQRGMSDFKEGRLPLAPAESGSQANDYYEGYEMNQNDESYPNLGRWGRGN